MIYIDIELLSSPNRQIISFRLAVEALMQISTRGARDSLTAHHQSFEYTMIIIITPIPDLGSFRVSEAQTTGLLHVSTLHCFTTEVGNERTSCLRVETLRKC